MLVDRLLARFKIQTKVIAFIVPFVLSISAVGLSGLYASRLLQVRMDMSNSVLQSLSGFKLVYAGMTEFLQHTSEETRSTLVRQLGEQSTLLKQVAAAASGVEGRPEIQAAIQGAESINGQIDALWRRYQDEVTLRKGIDADLGGIVKQQADLLNYATVNRENLSADEAKAKELLRDADRLTRGANLISKVVADFNGQTTPQQKMDVVIPQLAPLKAAVAEINAALPADQKVVAEQLTDSVTQIGKQAEIGIVNDATIGAAERAVNLMRPAAIRLQGVATAKARQATEAFGALDAPIAVATRFLNVTRQISDAVRTVELKIARYTTAPDAALLDETLGALMSLDVSAGALQADQNVPQQVRKRADAILPLIVSLEDRSEALLNLSRQGKCRGEAARRGAERTGTRRRRCRAPPQRSRKAGYRPADRVCRHRPCQGAGTAGGWRCVCHHRHALCRTPRTTAQRFQSLADPPAGDNRSDQGQCRCHPGQCPADVTVDR